MSINFLWERLAVLEDYNAFDDAPNDAGEE